MNVRPELSWDRIRVLPNVRQTGNTTFVCNHLCSQVW
jgi:hypothetical protein